MIRTSVGLQCICATRLVVGAMLVPPSEDDTQMSSLACRSCYLGNIWLSNKMHTREIDSLDTIVHFSEVVLLRHWFFHFTSALVSFQATHDWCRSNFCYVL
ncbi:hypothetical protein BDY19DRAFT_923615, partial [Irpex rosettiformis]